jgi:ketosteroid isomerase-like protein
MTHRRRLLSAAGLIFVAASCQTQKGSTFSDADRDAVRAAFDSTASHIGSGNFAAWASQFTEDARFMPPNHPIVRGRASLQAWADSLPPMTGFSFGDVTVDGAGDVAVGTSSYELTFNPPTAQPVPDKGKQLVAFRRQANGSWLVTAAAFSSDLPIPGTVARPTATPPAATNKK